MKILFLIAILVISFIAAWRLGARPVMPVLPATPPDTALMALSEQLLYAVKTQQLTDTLERALAEIDMPHLMTGLSNDDARKTFWINMYNAWFQILATREKKTNPGIFTDKAIVIAGRKFSLDDVEHGILRKYRWKLSLGYLPQFFPGRVLKQLSVNSIDYRIHFALNCGAKSCPPIAFYNYDKLDSQLDLAAESFLTSETEIDDAGKTIKVTKIMQWFKADFHGTKGIRAILSKYLGKDFSRYKISYKDYDWSAKLGYYQ